ncbi:hypothetical protein [Komagataeibacter xylinus]|uniref:hypothetical protein n=1 Tax=Komagataeibacter xylinus TaxID=28448 RepID=UPI001330591E|nr:hypothetical protein [Komagataeibacter xylinus]
MIGLHRTREYIAAVQNEDSDDLSKFKNMVKALALYSEVGIRPYDNTEKYPMADHGPYFQSLYIVSMMHTKLVASLEIRALTIPFPQNA